MLGIKIADAINASFESLKSPSDPHLASLSGRREQHHRIYLDVLDNLDAIILGLSDVLHRRDLNLPICCRAGLPNTYAFAISPLS